MHSSHGLFTDSVCSNPSCAHAFWPCVCSRGNTCMPYMQCAVDQYPLVQRTQQWQQHVYALRQSDITCHLSSCTTADGLGAQQLAGYHVCGICTPCLKYDGAVLPQVVTCGQPMLAGQSVHSLFSCLAFARVQALSSISTNTKFAIYQYSA